MYIKQSALWSLPTFRMLTELNSFCCFLTSPLLSQCCQLSSWTAVEIIPFHLPQLFCMIYKWTHLLFQPHLPENIQGPQESQNLLVPRVLCFTMSFFYIPSGRNGLPYSLPTRILLRLHPGFSASLTFPTYLSLIYTITISESFQKPILNPFHELITKNTTRSNHLYIYFSTDSDLTYVISKYLMT